MKKIIELETLCDHSGPERINKIIDEQNNDVVFTPSCSLKQIRERRIMANAFPHKMYTKMLQMGASQVYARRGREHKQINKIIPSNSPNPNKLTISSW